jgi:hypothetical protein
VWSLVLQVGGWVWGYDPTPENSLLRNHTEDQDPHRVIEPLKKKKNYSCIDLIYRDSVTQQDAKNRRCIHTHVQYKKSNLSIP